MWRMSSQKRNLYICTGRSCCPSLFALKMIDIWWLIESVKPWHFLFGFIHSYFPSCCPLTPKKTLIVVIIYFMVPWNQFRLSEQALFWNSNDFGVKSRDILIEKVQYARWHNMISTEYIIRDSKLWYTYIVMNPASFGLTRLRMSSCCGFYVKLARLRGILSMEGNQLMSV